MTEIIAPSFKDQQTRKTFAERGFVVYPGLAAHLVERLASVYADMVAQMPPSDPFFHLPMTGTNCISDLALRQRVLDAVGDIVGPALASILEDYRLIGAGFRVKQAGPDSNLPLHQDPTQVDESRYWLANFIIPLIDTRPENGALQIVPGSHRIMPRLRSLDLEDRAETLNLDEVVAPLVETIAMKAGDAIFYYQSLLHGSGPNLTPEARPVVLGTVMARDAPVTVYFRRADNGNVFEQYEVPDNYFNRMKDFDREHRLRPTVGRRLEDVGDTSNPSREDIVAAFTALRSSSDA